MWNESTLQNDHNRQSVEISPFHTPHSPICSIPMSEAIAQVLGRIPSGLFVLTVRHEERDGGMLASWVMQAGFEPPMVSVAVRSDRHLAAWLTAGSPFALHILPTGDKSLLKHFSRGFEPDEPVLEGLDFERGPHGVAVLKGTVGHMRMHPGRVTPIRATTAFSWLKSSAETSTCMNHRRYTFARAACGTNQLAAILRHSPVPIPNSPFSRDAHYLATRSCRRTSRPAGCRGRTDCP